MGITVVLEDENGARVEALDDSPLLLRVLRSADALSLPWTSTIDPYGDTTFNHLQAPKVRSELQRLIEASGDTAVAAFLRHLDALFKRCEDEPHLYVKLYGD